MFARFTQTCCVVCPMLLSGATGSQAAFGQATPVVKLGPSTATIDEELVEVYSGRELADGRLLIGEGAHQSRRLLVLDFARGTATQIGRRGNGPGEYQLIGRMFELANDSTIFPADGGRWLVLSGSRIVRTISTSNTPLRASAEATGIDSIGNMLSFDRISMPDSSGRVLVSRSTGQTIPVVRLRSSTEPGYPPPPTARKNGGITYYSGPWNSYELATLFPDGWLAVARVQPYRVDWRTPDGRWLFGKPIPAPVVRVNDREKTAYMQRAAERAGVAPRSPSIHAKWPREVPPFLPSALLNGRDGQLLILRTPTAEKPEVRYDVIDRQGRLQRQLLLERNQRIVAFGRSHVYVAVRDGDDLERIQRHAWPR
jgi:hypothetical protein